MKRFSALLLTLAMLLVCFTGCSGNETANSRKDDAPIDIESIPVTDNDTLEHEDLRYVMVYNPSIYEESKSYHDTILKSGDIAAQMYADMNRGEELEEETSEDFPYTPTPDKILDIMDVDLGAPEMNRADYLIPEYDLGDIRDFGVGYASGQASKATFTCVYEGDNCYIWTTEAAFTPEYAKAYGDAFDTYIYPNMHETFGTPRFVQEGGKVHLLFHPIYPTDVGGYYFLYDSTASGEFPQKEVDKYCLTTNHDILHVNLLYVGQVDDDQIFNVMAHEFQHLILGSYAFNTPELYRNDSWINEAMSGYVEEYLYPGIQKKGGRYKEYETSDQIRNGQSLYNFNTDNDIGVYGSVFLYSEYVVKLFGQDVFSKYHAAWADNFGNTLDEAQVLADIAPTSVYNQIDKLITYPSSIHFESNELEWMSKLTLSFYLTTLTKENAPEQFDNYRAKKLVYKEIDEAKIEGGGRIIIPVDGSFTIPEDADGGLVFIGLDKDFQIVTDFICS